MAKNNKNIEEQVDNEVKKVVEKVTETPQTSEVKEEPKVDETPQTPETTETPDLTQTPEVKEETKVDETPQTPEVKEEPKVDETPQAPEVKEEKEVSDEELEDVLKAIAACNWFNNLNIGQHLVNKFETTKEELKAFFDEYKTGNYLSSQEEYIVFRKLNDLFNN